MTRFFAGTCRHKIVQKAFKPGNTVSVADHFRGGRCCLERFWPSINFLKELFHRQMLCHVEVCRRRRNRLRREGQFTKGASNILPVVMGALAPGPFGSG